MEPPAALVFPARELTIIAAFLSCFDNAHSVKAYRRDIALFQQACPGGLHAQLQELAAWIAGMKAEGAAGKTVRRRLSTVRSLLNYARDIGYLAVVPVWKHLHLPPDTSTAVVRVLTREEVQQLVRHTLGAARLAVRLLYGTGMRVAEACALTWGDLRAGESGGGWARVLGKGGKVRDVGIGAALWSRLQYARGWRDECMPVLTLTPSQIDKAIRKAAKLAGMRKIPSAHWLRHSHITHAIEAGCPWQEAAEQAGHSSIAITQRIYAHLTRAKTSAEYLEDV